MHFESILKETGKMTKPTEREEAAFNAAKQKLDRMLAPLSKEERNTLLRLLLEATK